MDNFSLFIVLESDIEIDVLFTYISRSTTLPSRRLVATLKDVPQISKPRKVSRQKP